MIETLFEVLLAGLQVWDHERREEFARKALDLKLEWYKEYEKPIGVRSDDVLSRINIELRLICDSWTATVKSAATPSK